MELIHSCSFKFDDIKEKKFKLPFKINLHQDCLLMLYRNNEILNKNEHFKLNEDELEFLNKCKCEIDDTFIFEVYDIEDKLDKLFKIQFENNSLIEKFEMQQLVLAFTRALVHQTAELDNSFPWKWWKEQKFDLEKSKIATANIFITLISICKALNISSNEIFKIIKSGISNKEQEEQE